MSETRVAGVLLAAGEGRRLGGPKALLVLDGRPLVERGARTLVDAGCDPVVVVLGAGAEEVLGSADLGGVVTVVNDDWSSGMAGSFRAGVAACSGAPAVVVALVDQPGVTAGVVERLVAVWRAESAKAVVAAYDGEPRNPVLLDASVWSDALASATGDVGARRWLREHPDVVAVVECGDIGSGVDIDTPEDLEGLG